MSKLSIAKLAINLITGAGISKIVNDIITTNTIIETTEDTVKVAVGSIVLGSMIADHASDHVNAKIDWVAEMWENRQTIKAATK